MSEKCQIPRCIQKIFAASHCNIAYIGGSLTVGVGASDVSRTSWRTLFTQYVYETYHPKYHCQVSEVMGAIGASESYAAAFMLPRNVTPHNPDLAFIEFCVNDKTAPDKDLVIKGMEGMVRKLLTADNSCDVIILGTGARPGADPKHPDGKIEQSLHRQVAEHYDVPFVDMQSYILETLEERGESWEDIALEFEENDPYHLNDYGQKLSFEAMRDCFKEQVRRYQQGDKVDHSAPLPDPIVSDELQHIELYDPSKKKSGVKLEGNWDQKADELVPWYFDNLLVGAPGAKMEFTFEGTAVAVWGLMYNNGLKVKAKIDGEKTPGPYLRHFIEFGKGAVLAHGMENTEHKLELVVSEPSKRHNKLDNPSAQIAYIAVACPPSGDESTKEKAEEGT
ncbi:MAG: SGNH/GDSL hydrolase family protein [Planctomycetes bacterium]|nr:SGNH/GDSL hydrolase family protein [Planctomycetota bacterium]